MPAGFHLLFVYYFIRWYVRCVYSSANLQPEQRSNRYSNSDHRHNNENMKQHEAVNALLTAVIMSLCINPNINGKIEPASQVLPSQTHNISFVWKTLLKLLAFHYSLHNITTNWHMTAAKSLSVLDQMNVSTSKLSEDRKWMFSLVRPLGCFLFVVN